MDKFNALERDWRRFSPAATQALSDGRVCARPLVDALERVYAATDGIDALLGIVIESAVLRDELDDDCNDEVQAPLSGSTIWKLQRLARVTAELVANEIERLAEWADQRARTREGPGHE